MPQKIKYTKAATRFLKRAPKRIGVPPRIMVTEKHRSYQKVHRVLFKSVEHPRHKRLNNKIKKVTGPIEKKRGKCEDLKLQEVLKDF